MKRIIKPRSPLTGFFKAILTPAFQAVFLYRLASWFYQVCKIKIAGKIVHFFMVIIYNVDIHPGASIGPGLFVGHLNVVVSEYAKIGSKFSLTHCNTVGAKDPMSTGAPEIADNVLVCAGANILGNVKIGRNVIVGANAVVLDSIPDNHIAVGVPAIAKPGNNEYQKYYQRLDSCEKLKK